LHTCFAWLGHGAFTSRQSARDFLSFSPPPSPSELDFSDNFFTTLQNSPPIVIEMPLLEIVSQSVGAFSGGGSSGSGEGRARNERYIQLGVDHLQSSLLSASAESISRDPPALHAAPCASDGCAFITNVANLPPRGTFTYPSSSEQQSKLSEWQEKVESRIGKDVLEWVARWPYSAAADGDWSTAFRSVEGWIFNRALSNSCASC
jgi:hypothetical protein